MLNAYSIKQLYPLALAEGEGVGTAYEYYVKRLKIDRWLTTLGKRPRTMLVAGLPERYGSSLDAFLLGNELGAQVTVIDERPEAIDKLHDALGRLASEGTFEIISPESLTIAGWGELATLERQFDFIISSEVLQRLGSRERQVYCKWLWMSRGCVTLFVPNADNDSHTTLSGLSGLTLDNLKGLVADAPASVQTDYIDMPPFPPGVIRSEDQRSQASEGRLEAMAMQGLGVYARLEGLVPSTIRSRQSHIVYALASVRDPQV